MVEPITKKELEDALAVEARTRKKALDDLIRQIQRGELAPEDAGDVVAYDASNVLVGLAQAIKAGSNMTLTKSGRFIVLAATAGGGVPLTVQEADGSPSDAAVSIIRVPNGGLVDNGVGDVSLVFELAGVNATHLADGTDAHDASAISAASTTLVGVATDVQGVLEELDDVTVALAAADAAHAAAADPHAGYVREADANWTDLTDGGATTLHTHAGGGGSGSHKVVIARWRFDGRLRADTTNNVAGIEILPTWTTDADLDSCIAVVRLAPVGADIEIDIKHAATRAGAQTSLFAGGTPDYITIDAGDTSSQDAGGDGGVLTTTTLNGGFLFLYVRQVGSTAGSEGFDLDVVLLGEVHDE